MPDNLLVKLFEHNNWANLQVIQTCAVLTDEQLDTEPKSATYGSIRQTLLHLVSAQAGYLRLFTTPVEERHLHPIHLEYAELEQSVRTSGEGLIALVRHWEENPPADKLETTDGFYVETWLLIVQIIDHATEHREQIKSMLSALGVTPPEIDGWMYASVTNAMLPVK